MRGRRTRTDAPTSLHGCEQNSARGRQTVLRMHLSRAGPRRPFVASTRHTRIRRWGTWPASSRKRSLAAGRTWRRPSASSHRASVSDMVREFQCRNPVAAQGPPPVAQRSPCRSCEQTCPCKTPTPTTAAPAAGWPGRSRSAATAAADRPPPPSGPGRRNLAVTAPGQFRFKPAGASRPVGSVRRGSRVVPLCTAAQPPSPT